MNVCWFSAGISSFMAGVLFGNVDKWIYIDIADQHPDTIRFLKDCENALNINIEILKSTQYETVEDCIRANKVIKMPFGYAPCTNLLKKRVRKEWEYQHQDIELTYIWGFDKKEKARADRTIEANPQAKHEFPLIDMDISKEEVHGLFYQKFNFNRPKMYDLGYPNNNCIGCIKGGMGYWNKIRIDFPDVFEARAKLEREIGHSILKDNGKSLYLDELESDRGNLNTEIFPECSIMCLLNDEVNNNG